MPSGIRPPRGPLGIPACGSALSGDAPEASDAAALALPSSLAAALRTSSIPKDSVMFLLFPMSWLVTDTRLRTLARRELEIIQEETEGRAYRPSRSPFGLPETESDVPASPTIAHMRRPQSIRQAKPAQTVLARMQTSLPKHGQFFPSGMQHCIHAAPSAPNRTIETTPSAPARMSRTPPRHVSVNEDTPYGRCPQNAGKGPFRIRAGRRRPTIDNSRKGPS